MEGPSQALSDCFTSGNLPKCHEAVNTAVSSSEAGVVRMCNLPKTHQARVPTPEDHLPVPHQPFVASLIVKQVLPSPLMDAAARKI